MDDFYMNQKLCNECIDPCKGEQIINIITNAKLKQVFGKRECIGWKPKVNDHSIAANCDALSKLYDVVYDALLSHLAKLT